MTHIPEDFPQPIPAVVGGAQPKVAAILTSRGIYTEDGDSREERYEVCEDVAQQLVKYCSRKRDENPTWSEESTQQKIVGAFSRKVRSGEWKFSRAEQKWIEQRLRTLRNR